MHEPSARRNVLQDDTPVVTLGDNSEIVKKRQLGGSSVSPAGLDAEASAWIAAHGARRADEKGRLAARPAEGTYPVRAPLASAGLLGGSTLDRHDRFAQFHRSAPECALPSTLADANEPLQQAVVQDQAAQLSREALERFYRDVLHALDELMQQDNRTVQGVGVMLKRVALEHGITAAQRIALPRLSRAAFGAVSAPSKRDREMVQRGVTGGSSASMSWKGGR